MILWEDSGNQSRSATIPATFLLSPSPWVTWTPGRNFCFNYLASAESPTLRSPTQVKSDPPSNQPHHKPQLLDMAPIWNQMACVSSCMPVRFPMRQVVDQKRLFKGRPGTHLHVTHKLHTRTHTAINSMNLLSNVQNLSILLYTVGM